MATVLQEHDIPREVRELTTLERTDYEEMFVVEAHGARRHAPEVWARAAIEQPPAMRSSAPLLWRAIGLRMGSRPSADHVNGWLITERGDGWIRLEAASSYATIHVLVRVEPDEVQEAMFIRYEQRTVASAIWSVVGPFHRRVMPRLLRYAVRTLP
jgi:hypothetical protein